MLTLLLKPWLCRNAFDLSPFFCLPCVFEKQECAVLWIRLEQITCILSACLNAHWDSAGQYVVAL